MNICTACTHHFVFDTDGGAPDPYDYLCTHPALVRGAPRCPVTGKLNTSQNHPRAIDINTEGRCLLYEEKSA